MPMKHISWQIFFLFLFILHSAALLMGNKREHWGRWINSSEIWKLSLTLLDEERKSNLNFNFNISLWCLKTAFIKPFEHYKEVQKYKLKLIFILVQPLKCVWWERLITPFVPSVCSRNIFNSKIFQVVCSTLKF